MKMFYGCSLVVVLFVAGSVAVHPPAGGFDGRSLLALVIAVAVVLVAGRAPEGGRA